MRRSPKNKVPWLALTFLVSLPAGAAEWQLVSRAGQEWDVGFNRGFFSVEPSVSEEWSQGIGLEGMGSFEKPFDPYEGWKIPRTGVAGLLTLGQFSSWTLRSGLSAAALSIDQWSSEGYLFRQAAFFDLLFAPMSLFKVALRAGLFWQLSQFTQTNDGHTIPPLGFRERLSVLTRWGRAALEVRFFIEQKKGAVWSNDYGMIEELSFQMTPTWKFGVTHELSASLIDDSTGFYQGAFQGANRLSAFVGVTL